MGCWLHSRRLRSIDDAPKWGQSPNRCQAEPFADLPSAIKAHWARVAFASPPLLLGVALSSACCQIAALSVRFRGTRPSSLGGRAAI